MEPLPTPSTINIYLLLKQTGLVFTPAVTTSSTPSIGSGFFLNKSEAENYLLLETLKDSTAKFYVFELTIPSPIVK